MTIKRDFMVYMGSDESAHNQVDVLDFLLNDFCLFVAYSGHSMGRLPPYELIKMTNDNSFRSSNQSSAMFPAQFCSQYSKLSSQRTFGLLL